MFEIEVMLADDHTLVRQGIRSILEMEDDIRVIGEASSGREPLGAIKKEAPSRTLSDGYSDARDVWH
ncbi:MAG: hypothetical protein R2911_43505 [Caldilineaceae bacterium]